MSMNSFGEIIENTNPKSINNSFFQQPRLGSEFLLPDISSNLNKKKYGSNGNIQFAGSFLDCTQQTNKIISIRYPTTKDTKIIVHESNKIVWTQMN